MLPAVTLVMLLAALVHLFVAVYNRYLLGITDSWWKPWIHLVWFVVSVAAPATATIWLLGEGMGPVREALTWSPFTHAGKALFVVMGLLIAFFGVRLLIWFEERVFPERPTGLISERVSEAVVPSVTPTLPRGLRRLETTSDLLVTEREIAVAGLAPAFDGLTIAHVADIHFGQRLEMENYFDGVRNVVAGLDADIIVLTGDFVDTRRDISRAIEYHAGFRGRIGTFYVMGNHDYWTNAKRLREGFERTHLRWLGGGDRRILKRMGRRLIFTGTDAPWDGVWRPDFRRLVRRETGDAVVLLSHTPDNAPAAARNGASLVLSGHNHGGQICLPVLGPMIVPSRYGLRYAGGLYRVGADGLLNVSRGIGASSGKIRVLCRPEICLLTLRAPVVPVMAGRVITARAILKPTENAGEEGVMGY
ncbi:metallophosphoesterase [Candidatus Sumerlaeota bacterium]|nr:metallophosphoesterase [Candidatus Sumerlaeota bacterium]